jgi:hypothetical protein
VFEMHRYFETAVLVVLFVLAAGNRAFAQNEIILPLIVNTTGGCSSSCEYWTSSVSVFNPNDQPVTVNFTMYGSAGNIIGSSNGVTAGAFQTALVPPSIALQTGWIRVTSSQPLIGREYLQFYRVSNGVQDLRSRLYLSPAASSRRHFIRPESFGPVGVSIVFPSAANEDQARGKLIHRDTDGSTVSERDLVIPRNGQLIAYLRDLLQQPASVPSNARPEPLQGSFEIVFDHEVAVTMLQFAASEPLEEPVDALTGAIASQ